MLFDEIFDSDAKIIDNISHNKFDQIIGGNNEITIYKPIIYNFESIQQETLKFILQSPQIKTIKNKHNVEFTLFDDSHLLGGSKQRLFCLYVGLIVEPEIVYAGTENGYGQIALAMAGRLWNKKITIFVQSNKHTKLTKISSQLGAKVILTGKLLKDTIADAVKYSEQNKARYFKLGGDEGKYSDIFISYRSILSYYLSNFSKSQDLNKSQDLSNVNFWITAGSSFTANTISTILPDVNFNIVGVGKQLFDDKLKMDFKKYTKYVAKERFNEDTKYKIPYDALLNYDAKLWQFADNFNDISDVKNYIWNIAGSAKDFKEYSTFMRLPKLTLNDIIDKSDQTQTVINKLLTKHTIPSNYSFNIDVPIESNIELIIDEIKRKYNFHGIREIKPDTPIGNYFTITVYTPTIFGVKIYDDIINQQIIKTNSKFAIINPQPQIKSFEIGFNQNDLFENNEQSITQTVNFKYEIIEESFKSKVIPHQLLWSIQSTIGFGTTTGDSIIFKKEVTTNIDLINFCKKHCKPLCKLLSKATEDSIECEDEIDYQVKIQRDRARQLERYEEESKYDDDDLTAETVKYLKLQKDKLLTLDQKLHLNQISKISNTEFLIDNICVKYQNELMFQNVIFTFSSYINKFEKQSFFKSGKSITDYVSNLVLTKFDSICCSFIEKPLLDKITTFIEVELVIDKIELQFLNNAVKHIWFVEQFTNLQSLELLNFIESLEYPRTRMELLAVTQNTENLHDIYERLKKLRTTIQIKKDTKIKTNKINRMIIHLFEIECVYHNDYYYILN